MIAVMILFFLLQVFQRLTKHECDDAGAGYHEQKVRHGFHLPSVRLPRWNGVKPAPCLSDKPTENIITLYFVLNKSNFASSPFKKTSSASSKGSFLNGGKSGNLRFPAEGVGQRPTRSFSSFIYRLCTRSARIALSTARTITPTSAKIAAHMFAMPSAPSARQANLMTSANTMF